MLEARIQQQFFEAADTLYQLADALSRPVSEAAQAAVGCLTAGGKLLACGKDSEQDLANALCAALMLRFERPRPPLAAVALGAGPLHAPASVSAAERQQLLASQVRALGQPGDLLLVFAGTATDDAELRLAIDEAHAKDISVVLLSGGEAGAWPTLLVETDVWIAVAHSRAARVREVHLLALHCLCDAIDIQLLGETEPS